MGTFEKVVLEGLSLQNGMPKFEGRLTKEEIKDLQHFIINKTREKANKIKIECYK